MRKVFVSKWQKDNIQRIEFNYYWEKYVAFQSEKKNHLLGDVCFGSPTKANSDGGRSKAMQANTCK